MTPDAASSQPRKRSWKRWIVALACVVAVTTIALLATSPKKEAVAVWFVHSTNDSGIKKLVFQGTNGFPGQIYFFACVATGAIRHAKTPARLRPGYDLTNAWLATGTSFYFTLNAPPKDVRYFVAWQFSDNTASATRWGRFRTWCFNFFDANGMPALAERFLPAADVHYIPSTEFKE